MTRSPPRTDLSLRGCESIHKLSGGAPISGLPEIGTSGTQVGYSRLAVRRLKGWPLARSRSWPSFETRAILRGARSSGTGGRRMRRPYDVVPESLDFLIPPNHIRFPAPSLFGPCYFGRFSGLARCLQIPASPRPHLQGFTGPTLESRSAAHAGANPGRHLRRQGVTLEAIVTSSELVVRFHETDRIERMSLNPQTSS